MKEGRDVRSWIAFAFGFIHGFGFANVLREMELPRQALGWSLFSFNVGVEIGQMVVVVIVATALATLRSRSAQAGRRDGVAVRSGRTDLDQAACSFASVSRLRSSAAL